MARLANHCNANLLAVSLWVPNRHVPERNMKAVGVAHERLVFSRRVQVLVKELAAAIPSDARTVLDVGCGDGTIDMLLGRQRPELLISGVDVLIRPQTKIPVNAFDGEHLPFPDR